MNRFYERLDDGSVEGQGRVRETGKFTVSHGNGVVFLPEDIHAISTDDAESTLHLHLYGLALDQLHERLVFNTPMAQFDKWRSQQDSCRLMKLSAESLRERIQGSDELALVDVREGGAFAKNICSLLCLYRWPASKWILADWSRV
ncbi:MAG: hypothetical protein CM1200mP41_04970 [Gammaproteobacteria bacterium]|nr:MAG: hypothetical protein CM1200mP41_04970 [Gammaproteobacteria bacterium]